MFDLRRAAVSAIGFVLCINCTGAEDRSQTQRVGPGSADPTANGTGACNPEAIDSINRFIPHVSSVPATQGQQVRLFLHERVASDPACRTQGVVLFIHGGTIPSAVDYDLGYTNYSWMKRFAAEGFDTFSLDQSGYGFSPRPKMDDPCNMDPSVQDILIPNPLSTPCGASYPFRLTTSQSDWDEIDTAVDYIRTLRGVDKVNLVGWSGGGPRGGGYAYLHPEKVDKLFLYAPGYSADGPTDPPPVLPQPGFPMSVQTRSTLYHDRWDAQVGCTDQFDPRIREYVWPETMAYDLLGQAWGPGTEGIQRTSTSSSGWGWNRTTAGRVSAPTAIIVGEFDTLVPTTLQLYQDIGARYRMHITVPCGSHFLVWENNHEILLRAASEWLRTGTVGGQTNGRFMIDRNSELHSAE